jgi:hypothetical protein
MMVKEEDVFQFESNSVVYHLVVEPQFVRENNLAFTLSGVVFIERVIQQVTFLLKKLYLSS